MRIAYVHLPRFPAQRKVFETPSLAGQPFALVEDVRGARRVAFASGPLLKAGARSGMTLAEATALCPELQPFPYAAQAELSALTSLGEALLSLGPAFQLSAPEGLWLDASASHLCKGEEGLCRRILEVCAAHGYRARATVAPDPFTARALARNGEADTFVVPDGGARAALAPLPLSALDGAAASIAGPLRGLGLTTLGEVAALPPGAVVARLGAVGLAAHRLCRGEDDRVLVPAPVPEVLEESVALDWPAESMEPLLFALKTTLDRLCARLCGRRRAAIRLSLSLKLDPSGERSLAFVLARPSAQPKLLLELSKHRISDLTLENPVARISARVLESCDDPGQQLALGDGPQGDARLEVVLARLSAELGEGALFSAEVAASHRPEAAYSPRPFRVEERAQGLLAELPGSRSELAPASATSRERPSRLFPNPAPLEAFVDERGLLSAARLGGKRRRVTAQAGPERLCGEWWGDEPFSRDYFRVQLEGVGAAWIFRDARDGRFYLHGMFD